MRLRRRALTEVTNELQWQALSQIDFDLGLVITTLPGNIKKKHIIPKFLISATLQQVQLEIYKMLR